MVNTSTVTFILFSTLAAVLVSSVAGSNIITTPTANVENTIQIEKWLKNLNPIERKHLITIHFYLHDIVVGENKSVYNVTGPAIPDSPTMFGLIQVVDHVLTAERDYDSERVGRAQGTHILSDFNVPAIAMTWNFLFNDGSTLSMLGRQDVLTEQIVLPIVGGTGRYTMARGISVRRVLERNPTTLNALQEYTIYVRPTNPSDCDS